MRLPGYCSYCHKVRTVNVTRPQPGAVQVGMCDQCRDERDEKPACEGAKW